MLGGQRRAYAYADENTRVDVAHGAQNFHAQRRSNLAALGRLHRHALILGSVLFPFATVGGDSMLESSHSMKWPMRCRAQHDVEMRQAGESNKMFAFAEAFVWCAGHLRLRQSRNPHLTALPLTALLPHTLRVHPAGLSARSKARKLLPHCSSDVGTTHRSKAVDPAWTGNSFAEEVKDWLREEKVPFQQVSCTPPPLLLTSAPPS